MSTVKAWGEVGHKYDIHEETLDYFRIVESRNDCPLTQLTPEEARAAFVNTSRLFGGDVQFDGEIKDFWVPVPKVKGKKIT